MIGTAEDTSCTMSAYLLILILANVIINTEAKFSFVQPCPRLYGSDFDNCVLNSIRAAYPHYMDGNPEYNLPAMDPLHVDKLMIGQGPELLGYTLESTNVTILGLRDVNIVRGKVDPEEGRLSFDVTVPQLRIRNKYVLSGRVLSLYANGSGDCSMNLTNIKANVRGNFSTYRSLGRDGIQHEYFNVTELKIKLNIGKVKLEFNNLFNGNKVAERYANQFFSRYWRELFKFVGPAVERALAESVNKVADLAKLHLALDELYPYVDQSNSPASTS